MSEPQMTSAPSITPNSPPAVSDTNPEVQSLQQELATLRTQNEDLQRRKVDAERDRDLFRDLYSKASAHASSVSSENSVLLERAELAEGQVREGLVMIKSTYTTRIAALENEVKRLEGEARVLQRKDEATGGDKIRRLAGEARELGEENWRLRSEVEELREVVRGMEGVVKEFGEDEEEEELREEAEVVKPSLERPVPSEKLSDDIMEVMHEGQNAVIEV